MANNNKANIFKGYEDTHYTYFSSERSFKQYMKYVSSLKVLSIEEQKRYIKLYKDTKDIRYKEEIIKSNQRIVISISKRYCNNSEGDMMDYIQTGNYALLIALEKYNPDSCASYVTYATYWVRSAIERFKISLDPMRFNTENAKIVKNIGKICEYINSKLDENHIPSYHEIVLNVKNSEYVCNKIKDYIIHSYNIYSHDSKYRIDPKYVIQYFFNTPIDLWYYYKTIDIDKTIDISYKETEQKDITDKSISIMKRHFESNNMKEACDCIVTYKMYLMNRIKPERCVYLINKILKEDKELQNKILKLL